MIYADFEFYQASYFGKLIQEEDFPRLSLQASQYIDYITRGKAAAKAELEAVKMCCCALAEKYQAIETAERLAVNSLAAGAADGGEVSSESVGSWSRSYRSSGYSAQSAIQTAREGRSVLLETARQHLANTGLLYRGGGCGR